MQFQQPRLSPVVKKLLIFNVAVFILQLSFSKFGGMPVIQLFGFTPQAFFSGSIWQIVTYSFFHGSMSHIFFNLFSLFIFGNQLEARWGGKKFLKYYLVCAIGGAVLHSLVWIGGMIVGSPSVGALMAPTIGASGAIFGLMVAFGILYAESLIYLFGVLPIKGKSLVIGLLVYEIVSAVFFSPSGVAHLFHLGGMFAGYLMIKFLGHNLTGGGGGFGGRRIFKKKGAMTRDEVRQRLRIVSNNDPDAKGDKGIPITWN